MGFPPSDIGEKKFNWGSVASTSLDYKPFGDPAEGLSPCVNQRCSAKACVQITHRTGAMCRPI
jgi:hypothetical protein